jgi:uncharacterized membrane protein YphA (DoxX/SURF4 family)
MDDSPPNTASEGPEPSAMIRALVATLLRVGLGLNLLNTGLLGYMAKNAGAGMFGGLPPGATIPIPSGSDVYYQIISCGQIAVGLALVLGFFTTLAALLAGASILIAPLIQSVVLISGGATMNPYSNPGFVFLNMLSSGTTTNLLTSAAVLWFSTIKNNPWSLDALILSVRDAEQERAAARLEPPPGRPPGPPALPPGSRAATFIASRRAEGSDETGDPAVSPEGPSLTE